MDKKDVKNPYSDYTIEQIMEVEQGKYVIQIGSDFLSNENGKMAFEKELAEELYDSVLSGLNEMKESKDENDRAEAINSLNTLRLIPLRIH